MEQNLEEEKNKEIEYFGNLKKAINKKIEEFKQISIQSKEQFNTDQFKAIEAVLKRTLSFEELNVWSHLLEQRVGFGFKFDEAPHLKDATKIPVLVKDNARSFAAEKVPSLIDNGKTPPQPCFNCGR